MKKFSSLSFIILIISCSYQTRQGSTLSEDVLYKLDKVVKIGLISILYYHLHNEFSNSIDSLLDFKSYQKIFKEQPSSPDSTLDSLTSFWVTQIDSFGVSTSHDNKEVLSFIIKGTHFELTINLDDLKTEFRPVMEDSIQHEYFYIEKMSGELKVHDNRFDMHFQFTSDSISYKNPRELENATGEIGINKGEYKLTNQQGT